MPELLLDSVILIDHFNDQAQATQFLLGLDPAEAAISVITRAEILVGFSEAQQDQPKALLDQYVLLGLEKRAADHAAVLRRQHGWKLPDAFQAALALENKLILVTRDTKDFDPRLHSFVHIPYWI